MTGLSAGSTQTIFREGFLDLRNLPAPEMVPPDPDPQTKISILPAVSSHISGPEIGNHGAEDELGFYQAHPHHINRIKEKTKKKKRISARARGAHLTRAHEMRLDVGRIGELVQSVHIGDTGSQLVYLLGDPLHAQVRVWNAAKIPASIQQDGNLLAEPYGLWRPRKNNVSRRRKYR